ncbi:PilN domain-containing protein [Massilia sp. PAMC28688]|uniref:PilN domain-containing protein n=1 Tax=Massilia sp. PAMC28688 TaxID=2861283 RepID=UPI001C629211|nr:PilN domain-containing protein [Massilia sp. PAMC28688]QYF93314.1 PilN domain-containing protein [Massilia sp. PAMC28688]
MSQQINLFNPIFRKQKKYFSSVTMLQAMGIICVGCALLVVDAVRRTSSLSAQAAATESTLAVKQARLAEVKVQFAPRQRSATLGAEIAEAQETLTMLQNASATIKRGGFGDTTGFSPYFRALARQSVDGVWLTEVDIAGGGERLGVQGNTVQAALVPQYIARLAQEPVMKGKAFGKFDISTPVAAGASARYLTFSLQSGADAAGAGAGAAR